MTFFKLSDSRLVSTGDVSFITFCDTERAYQIVFKGDDGGCIWAWDIEALGAGTDALNKHLQEMPLMHKQRQRPKPGLVPF